MGGGEEWQLTGKKLVASLAVLHLALQVGRQEICGREKGGNQCGSAQMSCGDGSAGTALTRRPTSICLRRPEAGLADTRIGAGMAERRLSGDH